jgi:hypothetical protein
VSTGHRSLTPEPATWTPVIDSVFPLTKIDAAARRCSRAIGSAGCAGGWLSPSPARETKLHRLVFHP